MSALVMTTFDLLRSWRHYHALRGHAHRPRWPRRHEAGAHLKLGHRLDNLREAASEIVSVVRVKPHAIAIAPRHDAKAVVLDLRLLNPDLRLAQPLPRHFRA